MVTLVRLGAGDRLCQAIKFDLEVLDLGALGSTQDSPRDAGLAVTWCHLENKSLPMQIKSCFFMY